MPLIRFVLTASRRAFLMAVGAGIASGLSMVGLLAVTNQMLHSPQSVSVWSGGLFAVLVLSMVFFRVKSTVLLATLSQQSVARLRMRLCENILQAPLVELEKQGSHRLLATLSEDVNTIANGIMRLPFLCINIAIVSGCLVYMLWLSWWLFLLAIAFVGAGVILYRIPENKALQRLTQARKFGDELFAGFRAVSEGAKELKMHSARRHHFLQGPLQSATKGMQENTIASTRYYSYAGSLGIFLFFMIIGALIFVVPQFSALTSVTLVGYVMVFLFIQGPMEIIVNAIPDLAKTRVGLNKIQQLGLSLQQSQEHKSQDSPLSQQPLAVAPIKKHWQQISLNAVQHSYYREQEDSHFQLGPINMQFKKGELVFLIGGNGSGKTTFAKLLLGLYTPESGHIAVDEVIITPNNSENYRQLFSAVFVDFFLFEQLLGLEDDALDSMAQYYIDTLQLGHKVSIAEGRLSTVQLSQGQKKRLALVTAYLEDRDFYLFDEWAADQDPLFKRVFYTQILPDLRDKGKTLLVISHDEQYFHLADRYIKMDSGMATMSEHLPAVFPETDIQNTPKRNKNPLNKNAH